MLFVHRCGKTGKHTVTKVLIALDWSIKKRIGPFLNNNFTSHFILQITELQPNW